MNNTDEAIVKRILKGDGQAFEELICKYQKTVYNICLRFMRDEQDALDMTQEVLVSIYNNIEKFKFKSKFSTWIYRLCTNACLNELKKQQRIQICKAGDNVDSCSIIRADELNCTADMGNPQELMEYKETRDFIDTELKHMGEQAGAVMRLRLFGQKKFSEIAGILKIPDSTARTTYVRARKRLQESLSYYNKEGE